MQRRRLGGLEVSAVGLGCATMTPFYDEPDRDAAIETLRRAREIGVDFLDSSDAYGRGRLPAFVVKAVRILWQLPGDRRPLPAAGGRTGYRTARGRPGGTWLGI